MNAPSSVCVRGFNFSLQLNAERTYRSAITQTLTLCPSRPTIARETKASLVLPLLRQLLSETRQGEHSHRRLLCADAPTRSP